MQQELDELNLGERLLEDGVCGKKTDGARESFLAELARGTFPTLAWLDPLQSSWTRILAATKIARNGRDFPYFVFFGSNMPLFGADLHSHRGNTSYYLINVDPLTNASAWQKRLASKLDHTEISKEAYDILKDFQHSAKVVRIAGRVLLVAGAALDALGLCDVIDGDLHDAHQKIGKKTYSTAASIGGSWAGGALGAKGGALAGAAIGTAILPGLGTAVGGIAGGLLLGVAGSSLRKWVIDITDVGE